MNLIDCLKESIFTVLLSFISLTPVLASNGSLPIIQTWTTASGVPVYFVKRTQLPILDINLVFNAGSSRDPVNMAGLSQLSASLLGQATTTLNADQIARAFGDHGSVFETDATRDWLSLHLRTLVYPSALQPSVDLFNQVITQPVFTPSDISRKKAYALSVLRYNAQKPTKVAIREFFQTLYESSPYAQPVEGTISGIDTITKQAIEDFYQRYLVLHNAKIILVGDLSLEQAKLLSEGLLKNLSKGTAVDQLPEKFSHDPKNVHTEFHSQQAAVLIGYSAVTRNSPDYYALLLGNHILGGMPLSSILFEKVRNQHGLAYSISSVLYPLQKPGPWFVILQTKSSQTAQAIALVKQQIDQLANQPVSQKQLRAAQKNLIGSFPIAIASNEDLLAVVTRIAFYDRPLDYMAMFYHHIHQVSAQDIQQAFKRLTTTHPQVIVTVGPNVNHAS